MNITTKTDAFLLVEGDDDRNVFSELRDQNSIPRNLFTIKVAGSKTELDQQITEELHANDRRVIGIVLDADTDINASWQSIKDRIKRTKPQYHVPDILNKDGIIIDPPDEDHPRLGVWLMPNNQIEGELEDFVRECIVTDDSLISYADDVLNEIERENVHRYRNKRSKAFVYTWLAWQKEPGKNMRTNFQQGVLSASSPIAQTFVDWLNRLFNV